MPLGPIAAIMCGGTKRTAERSRRHPGGDVTTITDRFPALGNRLQGLGERLTEAAETYPRTSATYVRAVIAYVGFMTAWIYGVAALDRDLPGILVFVLLVLPVALHVWVGFAIGREEALLLTCYPPLLAFVAPGLGQLLAVTLLILMICPGAPLVFAAVFTRKRIDSPPVEDWF
jgi:hypothetical protein